MEKAGLSLEDFPRHRLADGACAADDQEAGRGDESGYFRWNAFSSIKFWRISSSFRKTTEPMPPVEADVVVMTLTNHKPIFLTISNGGSGIP